MKHEQAETILHKNIFDARMNQQYHAALMRRWKYLDRAMRVAVGLLTVASFGASAISHCLPNNSVWSWRSVAISAVAALVGVSLSVLLVGEWEKLQLDLFRRWTSLRRRLESLKIRIDYSGDDVPELLADEIEDASSEKYIIESDEPPPMKKLLKKVYDEQYAIYEKERANREDMERRTKAATTVVG